MILVALLLVAGEEDSAWRAVLLIAQPLIELDLCTQQGSSWLVAMSLPCLKRRTRLSQEESTMQVSGTLVGFDAPML